MENEIVAQNQDVGMAVNYQDYFQSFPTNEPQNIEDFNVQKPKGESRPQIKQK